MQTISIVPMPCDGCGQPASPEHLARRLQRLEWTTRYRPVHISALLLGAVSPSADTDFLYAGTFAGEAARLLNAVGISAEGKSAETVLSEFQRGGFLLTHVLECPLERASISNGSTESLFAGRIPQVITRIRRSLKPKRVVLISEMLSPLVTRLAAAELTCPVVLHEGRPFGLDSSRYAEEVQHLRDALNPSL